LKKAILQLEILEDYQRSKDLKDARVNKEITRINIKRYCLFLVPLIFLLLIRVGFKKNDPWFLLDAARLILEFIR
jgi:ABC-type uncharacterized transport system involved in gliding motility auxiliary subunit